MGVSSIPPLASRMRCAPLVSYFDRAQRKTTIHNGRSETHGGDWRTRMLGTQQGKLKEVIRIWIM
jgi:hypothetical protein